METSSAYASPKIAYFLDQPIISLVKQRIRAILASDGPLQKVLDDLQETNGKMVRPILVALSSELSGGCDEHALIDIATGIELIHIASLVHDDIIDEAELRRNEPTIQSRYGQSVAVLTGDYLFSTAFLLFTNQKQPAILHGMTDAIREMCTGEVNQLVAPEQTEAFYWRYIYQKTACLLGAACKSGPLLAGDTSLEVTNQLEQFGVNLGYAFQLIDDLLDYVGDTDVLGKSKGIDFRQGLYTLPIIRAMNRSLLPNDWVVSMTESQVTEILKCNGLLDELYQEACAFSQKAIDILDTFPPSDGQRHLVNLAQFIVERKS